MQTCYTYDETTKRLAAAPKYATIDGAAVINPTREQYARMDPPAYPLGASTPPEPSEGKIAVPDGFALEGGEWVQQWKLEDAPPPPPRRWTRLDILTALGESDMFDAAFAYLNSIEVKPHITAWLGLNTANYIEEFYPDPEKWNALLDGAAIALGKTREEIDAFLDAIPTEG